MTPDEKVEYLQKMCRSLTKQVGEALEADDHNEAAHLRERRSKFSQQLIDEFDIYFYVADGKSTFGGIEDAQEHYQKPENRRAVAHAEALTEMFQGRELLKTRLERYEAMTADELKAATIKDLTDNLQRVEDGINDLRERNGKPALDFDKVDTKKDGFLDGIDLDSLK